MDSTDDQPVSPDNATKQRLNPLEVSNWIEGTIVGGATFVARILTTLWLMSVAPRRIIHTIEANAAQRRLVHPFTFLLILILPVALAFEYWELPQAAECLITPQTTIDTFRVFEILTDLQQLTVQDFFLQTAPTALLVVGVAFVITRLLGDRKPLSSSSLIAVMCYVVGYRLFVRLCQAGLNLLLLPLLLRMKNCPDDEKLLLAMLSLGLLLPIALLMAYGFLFAGWITMYAGLRRWARGWLVHGRLMTAFTSGLICFVIYLPSVFTPALIGMVQKLPNEAVAAHVAVVDDALRAWPDESELPVASEDQFADVTPDDTAEAANDAGITLHLLDKERLLFDGQTHLLVAPLILRNTSTSAYVVRAPRQVAAQAGTRRFYCRLVDRASVDEFEVLQPGEVTVWQLMVYLPHGNMADDPLGEGLVYSADCVLASAAETATYQTVQFASRFDESLNRDLAALFARQRRLAGRGESTPTPLYR